MDQQTVRITKASNGEMVGVYHPAKSRYVQKRDKIRHALRYPPAWGMDQEILEALEGMGAVEWVIYERSSNVFWRLPLTSIRELGFQDDRGAGPQWFVEHRYWQQIPAGQRPLF